MRIAKPSKEDFDEMLYYFKKQESKGVKSIPFGWRRVVWAAIILVDECADPTEDHLDWSPYFEKIHVAAEQ